MREFSLFGALLSFSAASAAAPAPNDPIAGAWTYDAALSAPQADSSDVAPSSGAPSTSGGHHHSSGMGGGSGVGGSHGGGSHHHAAPTATAGSSNKEEQAERGERGLSRMFANSMTITPLKQRIRLDDGDHIVELDRDGMNVSGPGVGGTVALSATKPDFIVQTLTDSGYALEERYHLADDGQHLEVHISLKRPGVDQATQFVRVFDRPALATRVIAPPLPPAH